MGKINQHQKLAIEALRDMRGDDLERVRIDFAQYTPEQMQESYGILKESRQDILNWHIERAAKIDAAIEWIKTIGGQE
jgi:hypothetical protein